MNTELVIYEPKILGFPQSYWLEFYFYPLVGGKHIAKEMFGGKPKDNRVNGSPCRRTSGNTVAQAIAFAWYGLGLNNIARQ